MTSECHARKSVTRDELYALVWNEPMETVAVRYGLSGRGLAKIRSDVLRTGRGSNGSAARPRKTEQALPRCGSTGGDGVQ